jgi:hypothetical protein
MNTNPNKSPERPKVNNVIENIKLKHKNVKSLKVKINLDNISKLNF